MAGAGSARITCPPLDDTGLSPSDIISAIHTFDDLARFLHKEIIGIVPGSPMDEGDAVNNSAWIQTAYTLGK